MEFMTVPTDWLRASPLNHRTDFDQEAMQGLAESIKSTGIIEPLIVRELPDDQRDIQVRYEIVAGHRRHMAATMAGLAEVPVIVRELTDEETIVIQLVENVQRENVSPVEEARGLERLRNDHGFSIEALMEKTGKSRSHIYNTLRLLNRTTEAVRSACSKRLIGREIAGILALLPLGMQDDALKKIISKDESGVERAVSYREAKRRLQSDKLMIPIAEATFDVTDPLLAPRAGACGACNRLSQNDPVLASEIDPDVCTDRECFDVKAKTNAANIARKAREEGAFALEGEEADKAMPYPGAQWFHDYAPVDKEIRHGDKTYTVQDVIEKMRADGVKAPAVGVHINSKTSKATPIITNDDKDSVLEYLKQAEPVEQPEAPQRQVNKPREFASPLHEMAFNHFHAIRCAARTASLTAARQGEDVRILAGYMLETCDNDSITPELTDFFGWTAEIDAAEIDSYGLTDWIIANKLPTLTPDECASISMYIGINNAPAGYMSEDDFPDKVIQLASLYNVDIDLIASQASQGTEQDQDDDDEAHDLSDEADSDAAQASDDKPAPAAAWPAPKPASGRPAAKYRNPETGETWSGRGLMPKWLQVATAAGKTLSDFDTTATTAAEEA